MSIWPYSEALWMVLPLVGSALAVLASAMASAHLVVRKRHIRAVFGWLALLWLAPVFGVLAYVMFGLNRIERKASRLRGASVGTGQAQLSHRLPEHLHGLAALGHRVSGLELVDGNRVELLEDGDAFYPALVEAIRGAQHSVGVCMYIFEVDGPCGAVVDALAGAAERGVEVRVLVDGIGSLYSLPWFPATHLRRRGVPAALFLWSLDPRRMALLNLRNHRKLVVVDGCEAFTGGMNLRRRHVQGLADSVPEPTRDVMAHVRGPVVAQLVAVFAEDWQWTTGEELSGPAWRPASIEAVGHSICRAVPDGPQRNQGVTQWTVAGALASARRSVRILTPYFLPEEELETALEVAALQQRELDVVLPCTTNYRVLDRAIQAESGSLLRAGVRMWFTPKPFDHSKVMVVDDCWMLIGSSNWDARSLRLNFELGLEVYDEEVARAASDLIDRRRRRGEPLTVEQVAARPWLQQVIDGVARLGKPYL